VETRRLMKEFP